MKYQVLGFWIFLAVILVTYLITVGITSQHNDRTKQFIRCVELMKSTEECTELLK